jgi:uncharacterized protein HemY
MSLQKPNPEKEAEAMRFAQDLGNGILHIDQRDTQIAALMTQLVSQDDAIRHEREHSAALRDSIHHLTAKCDALEKALRIVRESMVCTKRAPHSYDANHMCSECGSSTAYAKDVIDDVLPPGGE